MNHDDETAGEQRRGVVTAKALNLRPRPSTERDPIAVLRRGDDVAIRSTRGAWYEVTSGQGEGFIHGNYVEVLCDEPATAYLHEEEDLREIPLEPGETVTASDAASAQERQLARTWNRTGGLMEETSRRLHMAPAASLSVFAVESRGRGFANGRLLIRFESHVFWRKWGDTSDERRSAFRDHFRFDPSRPWQGQRWREDPDGDWRSYHGDQSREWEVLGLARGFDESAALASVSMGAPQIMGFNHSAIGYGSPDAMFGRFREDLRFHVLGFFDFVRGAGETSRMLEALRRRDFEDFARRYNGPGRAAKYAGRMTDAFESGEALLT